MKTFSKFKNANDLAEKYIVMKMLLNYYLMILLKPLCV